MKNLPPLLILCLLLTFASRAQESNEPKLPYFSYKSGIGIATPDSLFSINIRFRMQHRFLMNTVSDEDFSPSSWEARVRRTRLVFTGHAGLKNLTYYLQLSFSRGDMDWSVTETTTQNTSPNVVRDAMVFYKPVKNIQLGFGQTKLPGNRQRVVSSGALQFYDRSPVNATFTLDRDFGAFVYYTLTAGKSRTLIKTAVTSGEGRNSVTSNTGLAYTGRIEFLPFGEFTDGGDYFEGDVVREEKLKLSLAGGYHFNDLAVRNQGQLGRDLYAPRSYHVYLADFLMKYQGWAVSSEYIRRDTDKSPFTFDSKGASRYVITGEGINTQLSYCFPSRWELAGRYTHLVPHKDIIALLPQINQYGLGITKYILKHKVKAQFNIFFNHERNLITAKDMTRNMFGVFQVEMGI
jgi:phosphate-selective porin OprO and OprP